jgi:hypothetical protein
MIFAILVSLGIVFTALALLLSPPPARKDGAVSPPVAKGFGLSDLATIASLFRGLFFPFASSIVWGFLALISVTVNNCVGSFSCYSDPGLTTASTTIVANPLGLSLSYLFWFLCAVMLVYGVVIAIVFSFAIHPPNSSYRTT